MYFEAVVKERKCRLDEIDGQVKAALSEHVRASEQQESVLEANWSPGSPVAKSEECPASSSVSQEFYQRSCWT